MLIVINSIRGEGLVLDEGLTFGGGRKRLGGKVGHVTVKSKKV